MKQRKIIRLVQVRNERKAAEAECIRREMFQCVRNATARYGDDLSGFALATWNRKGHMRTALSEGWGPLSSDIIPGQVKDALVRHTAISMADVSEITEPEPENA